MVPLALVYALILHAYAIKIIVNGSLPKGQIGLIVSLFAIGGTATWLVGWPWRETGTKMLRLFMRAWFWLLPVPAVLLAIAIWRRVSDYGVTPDRYAIAIVAVWTALVFAYLVLRRNRADMRMILGGAAVLLLVGSFGPQGAYGTTGASQFARLKSFLEAKGVLKDGKVVVKTLHLGQDDRINVETMVYALNAVNELEPLRPWFKESDFSSPGFEWNQWSVSQLLAGNDSEVSQNSFAFTPQLPVDHAWGGKTRFIGPLSIVNYYDQKSAPKLISPVGVSAWLNDIDLRFSVDGKDSSISSEALIKALNVSAKIDSSKLAVAVVDVSPQFSLMINQAIGHTGTRTSLSSMTFWIVQHE
jgi:hypothetical protein